MKKKMLLFTVTSALSYLALTSYQSGAARNGQNRSGAQSSSATCGGGGCHGGNSANTTIAIALDSNGTAVTKYRPGVAYTIVLTGHNTTLTQFGFQFASVSGTGSSQVQAGTSTAPVSCRISTLSGINFVEQSVRIAGSGGNFTESIPWTAPAAGKGAVTMYCTLNAVDGNGNQNSADVSANTSIVIAEGYVGVPELTQDIAITAYPNPATSQFKIKMDNAGTGAYKVNVYDMSGRIVATENIQANGANTEAIMNCSSWAKGYYGIQISQNGAQRVLPFVKL